MTQRPPLRARLDRHPWSLEHKLIRGTWQVCWAILGKPGPRFLSRFRVLLLRLFGARIGRGCLICGRVDVLMPWNLELGNAVSLGEGVNVYNFGRVTIGDHSVVSQGTWLCTGTHDHTDASLPLRWQPIHIGASVWITAQAFVHPGTTIGDGVVIGARSVVMGDIPAWTIQAGNPCKFVKPRIIKSGSN